jgi:hypothetical protein
VAGTVACTGLSVQGTDILTALDGKQATITTNSLAISDVSLLQSSLDAKQDTLDPSSLVTVGSLTSGELAVSGAATCPDLSPIASEQKISVLLAPQASQPSL